MRKVIFGGASTLDNYISRPDGAVDWLLWSDEAMELMKDYWQRFDAIVMGRKTYDVAMQNAPKPKKGKKAEDAGGVTTYVFSRSIKSGARDGANFIADDPGKFVGKLKKQKGKDICIMGSGELARGLFDAGVIDEIGFNIHPVLLGSGVPLFHEMKNQIDLELIECRPFKNGCVYVSYKVRN